MYSPKGINAGRRLIHNVEERQTFGTGLIAQDLGTIEGLPDREIRKLSIATSVGRVDGLT